MERALEWWSGCGEELSWAAGGTGLEGSALGEDRDDMLDWDLARLRLGILMGLS